MHGGCHHGSFGADLGEVLAAFNSCPCHNPSQDTPREWMECACKGTKTWDGLREEVRREK